MKRPLYEATIEKQRLRGASSSTAIKMYIADGIESERDEHANEAKYRNCRREIVTSHLKWLKQEPIRQTTLALAGAERHQSMAAASMTNRHCHLWFERETSDPRRVGSRLVT